MLVEQLRASYCFVVFWNKTLTIFKWFGSVAVKSYFEFMEAREIFRFGKNSYNANE